MLPCADPGGYRAAQCAYNHLHGGVWQKIGLWMNMIDIEPDRDIWRDTSKLRVPFPKTDSSSLKIGFPKRKLVFQPSIFRCHVSFREDIYFGLLCD